jgi:hypothetical protein
VPGAMEQRAVRRLVTAGEGCLNYRNEAWPIGFPPDWPTDIGVEVRPDQLSMLATLHDFVQNAFDWSDRKPENTLSDVRALQKRMSDRLDDV